MFVSGNRLCGSESWNPELGRRNHPEKYLRGCVAVAMDEGGRRRRRN